MDLFTPLVLSSRLHPNFQHVIQPQETYIRDVLNQWAEGFVDRDGKFVKEFQTTFNSSFWELYLFACFKELGLAVDFSHSSPDFICTELGTSFCIEAATANHAADEPPEWLKDIHALTSRDPVNLHHLVQVASLRLTNALTSKHKKYLESYTSLSHVVGRPFVIAVAPFEQPLFFMQNTEAIRKVLYGHEFVYTDEFADARTGFRQIVAERFIQAIEKPNGASVPVGVFKQGSMKEISAVIYSNLATYSKAEALCRDPNPNVCFSVLRYSAEGPHPDFEIVDKAHYRENLLDGLNVFHNPFATYPLPSTIFQHSGVTQHWFDPVELEIFDDASEGGLIQRMVIKLRMRDAT